MLFEEIYNDVMKIIQVPQGFEISTIQKVKHNEEDVHWLRFTKEGNAHKLGTEHFSITYDASHKIIKGYMRLDKSLCIPEASLLSEEEAKDLAFKFVEKYAADMVNDLELRWIKPLREVPQNPPHDQGFLIDGDTLLLGVRVKLWNKKEEKFSWVIVGKDGEVISFERDIRWDFERKVRLTQRWLHDNWLMENNVVLSNHGDVKHAVDMAH